MNSLMLLMAMTTPGVDFGWQSTAQGLEYIVQVEPSAIDAMLEGKKVHSLVPDAISEISQVRVHAGTQQMKLEDLQGKEGLSNVVKEPNSKPSRDKRRARRQARAQRRKQGEPAQRQLPSDDRSETTNK